MTPYWKRRIDGQRFAAWGTFILTLLIAGTNVLRLLRPRPLDGSDYFIIAAWTFCALVFGFRLFWTRRRGRPTIEPGS